MAKDKTTTAIALHERPVALKQGSKAISELTALQYANMQAANMDLSDDLVIGALYILKTGEIWKIVDVEAGEPVPDWKATAKHWKGYNFKGSYGLRGRVKEYEAWEAGELTDEDLIWTRPVKITYRELLEDHPEKWGTPITLDTVKKFFEQDAFRLRKPLAEYQLEATEVQADPDRMLDKYEDGVDFSNNAALVSSSITGEQMAGVKDELALKRKHVGIVAAASMRPVLLKRREVEAKIAEMRAELEKQMAPLQKMKDEMYGIMAVMKKKIRQLEQIIATIEIYLGVGEDVVQIQEGPAAADGEAVNLFQMLLYMDEEVGDPRELSEGVPGIHSGNIQDFDSWLLQPRNDGIDGPNYERLIPLPKGVVALQVSRQTREYYTCSKNADFWTRARTSLANAERNGEDRGTYILIRNGYNIYRVMSGIDFRPRLFPLRDEFQNYFDELQKGNQLVKDPEDSDAWVPESAEVKRERISDKMYEKQFPYMRRALLLEGLLHRTEIFHPVPPTFTFSKTETHGDFVRFIHDDENVLPDGRLPFKEFKKQANARITRGSRVVIVGGIDNDTSRFDSRFHNDHGTPRSPQDGVYTVEREWLDRDCIVRTFDLSYDELKACRNRGHEELFYYNSHRWSDSHEITTKDDRYKTFQQQQQVQAKVQAQLDAYDGLGEKDHGLYWNKRREWVQDKEASYKLRPEDHRTNWYDRRYEGKPGHGHYITYKELRVAYKSDKLYILYNPNDDIYDFYTGANKGKRKNRIRFYIHRLDKEVLNYDQMDPEDVHYYLHARHERVNYMWMVRELWHLRDALKTEHDKEAEFIKHAIVDRYKTLDWDDNFTQDFTRFVWRAVAWWKNKVINKRPITDDTGKAYRMITKKCNEWLKLEDR